MAAPAGLTCLNDAAAGIPVASFSSFTNCQLLRASRKFMYPGRPFKTSIGNSPSVTNIREGFWLGLQPYLSSNYFIVLMICM